VVERYLDVIELKLKPRFSDTHKFDKEMKNSIKKEQSQTGLNSAERENFRTSCKKYIAIEEEVLVRLVEGKYVEGSLHRDKWTGVISFNAYNRQPRKCRKDELLKKTPWGWVKSSLTRHKRFSSVPRDISLAEQLAILDEENKLVKEALIDRELINRV